MVDSLGELIPEVSPWVLLPAATGCLGHLTVALSSTSFSPEVRGEVLLLAARAGDLCGRLAAAGGKWADAERFFLDAARTAAMIGQPVLAAVCLSNLSMCHMRAGDPDDGLLLLDVSRSMAGHGDPGLTALNRCREAVGRGRAGDEIGSFRLLERAYEEVSGRCGVVPGGILSSGQSVTEEWLAVSSGIIWADLRRPRRALDGFSPALGADIPERPFRMPTWIIPLALRVHLDLGNVDEAVHHARRAVLLLGGMPTSLGTHIRGVFSAYRTVPSVSALLAELRSAAGS
ncbi:hypothetical protein ACFVSN_43270 [Kitasatospora sp. NPDC057904]|uniref:hypothetical protein n=1 Tax=Kitasatospora sp. NPDC057904 TaxID=3346275 RepID=UPI0036D76663